MEKIKIAAQVVVLFFLLLLNLSTLFAQYVCGDTAAPLVYVPGYSNTFAGCMKPLRTDMNGNSSVSEKFFRILIVFVQYANDVDNPEWPTGEAPIYIDSVIASEYSNPMNWWEAYNPNTQIVSSYWMDVSKGRLNVIGDAYSVVLSGEYSKYNTLKEINEEIWENLRNQGITDWSRYDNWKDTIIDGEIRYLSKRDNYLDMVYMIHKNGNGPAYDQRGIGQLGELGDSSIVDAVNNVTIMYGPVTHCSGLTFTNPSKHIIFNGIFHEHGHFLIAPGNSHITYGKMGYGAGYDGFFSPYERLIMNYMRTTDVNFTSSNTYILGDYNSHDTTRGNILKVPIQGEEFFLLANRGNVSSWDKQMGGDTADVTGPFAYTGNYGKGLYIYHVKDQIHIPQGNEITQDLECADGIYNWDVGGTAHRYAFDAGFCYDAGNWPYYKKTSVSYDNDPGFNNSTWTADDQSFGQYLPYSSILYAWAGIGKVNSNSCLIGTDRALTTSKQIITMDKYAGDRYDAWRVGYNEVFSPYSSPSTKQWNNDESGIFIYLKGTDNTSHSDTLKIYSTSVISEDYILEATPPSRPMGLSVEEDTVLARIKLKWNHNMEPDMLRGKGEIKQRKYNIYKAVAGGDSVPSHYVFLASVFINEGDDPVFIDTSARATCCIPDIGCVGGPCYEIFQTRYEVTAVDNTDWESVRSDFQGTLAWKWLPGHEGEGGDEHSDLFHVNLNIPAEYKLYQNYPNPFNPTTNIVYDLPKDGLVSIKVYDILGKEVKTLINEFKHAGSYLIPFEGKEFASGVYFYRIVLNNFVQTKRMILMK